MPVLGFLLVWSGLSDGLGKRTMEDAIGRKGIWMVVESPSFCDLYPAIKMLLSFLLTEWYWVDSMSLLSGSGL